MSDYESFTKHLDTGDIILYHSTAWYSKIIEYFTSSEYSHVAIILKKPIWLDPSLNEDFYILESGIEDFGDAIDKKIKFGVQISSLQKIYNEYKNNNSSKLYTRKLNTNIKIQDKIKEAYDIVKNKPYDTDPIDWIYALFELNKDINKIHYERTDKFWCSALVTFIYVKCGFLEKNISWTLISPSDYCCYDKNKRLHFKNCNFENDICIL